MHTLLPSEHEIFPGVRKRIKEVIMEDSIAKVKAVLEHISNVQRYGYKLGFKLMEMGMVDEGRILISNIQKHDNSKFSGIEFKHLFYGDLLLKETVMHHQSVNPHHPEYWGNIHNMPDIYVAEMVCDCAARSSEFGTDVRKWFNEEATKKYGFDMMDPVGIKVNKYLNLLLSPAFVTQN